MNEFKDIWLLTSHLDRKGYKYLIQLNNTIESKCCFEDGIEGAGIMRQVSGLARIVTYQKSVIGGKNGKISSIWEGHV